MMSNEPSETKNWVSQIIEGGLPQIIAGPAGKAISRLIGAGVEIPAAYLEGIAQRFRDQTEAKSAVSRAITASVSSIAANDPSVTQRAMNSMLDRAYRFQENKDAVAAIAVEDLLNSPPNPKSPGPSDDWMTKFERFAEDASSDDLRTTFGKLLAGEIREPGTISQSTLHFMSMLDGNVALLIERTLSSCIENKFALYEIIMPRLTLTELIYIKQSGFWSDGNFYKFKFASDGFCLFRPENLNFGVLMRGKPNSEFRLLTSVLSRAGSDLAKTIGTQFDLQALANIAIGEKNVTNFYYGDITYSKAGATIENPTELFKE